MFTALVASAVAAAVPASAAASAAREEPVSKTCDAGCVGRSEVGSGGAGLAAGGALRGAARGTGAEGVAAGEAWVPLRVEGTTKAGAGEFRGGEGRTRGAAVRGV